MLVFRILGPIEASEDEQRLPLSGSRQISLLAVLLVNANQVVSTDALIEAVWGSERDGALKRLQMAITRLRKVLGAHGEQTLRTIGSGYSLEIAPEQCDALAFESRVRAGSTAFAAGYPQRAADELRGALELWRGPALADVAFHDFAQPAIRRLDDLRLAAVETRISADLELGRHTEIVGEIEALVAAHPGREGLAGLLMQALYRCGRQTDALGIFQATRVRLQGEFGLDPGPSLQRLQAQILAQDPALMSNGIAARVSGPAATAAPDPSPPADLPLPPMLRAGPPTPCLGRVRERELLHAAAHDATTGARRIVLVGGEPGVGKTRLAMQASTDVHAGGFAVAWGASVEHVGAPYGAWISALSGLAEHAGSSAILERHGSVLRRLLPVFESDVEPAPATDPEIERYLLFRAVVTLLEELSARHPVALVFDDLQWADAPSLTLLAYVARVSPHLRLLVLATYRDAAPGPLLDLLKDLSALDGVDRLELAGLPTGDVAALIAAFAGHDIGATGMRLAEEITQETGGNPFFVGQLLRHLTESRALERDELGRWRLRTPIGELQLPPRVHDVVRRRVERLGPRAAELLPIAAVIGRSFDLELLARLTDIPEDEVLAVLEDACAGAILAESASDTGWFSFSHAIVNHSLYATLGRTRAAKLHCQVAEALEALPSRESGDRLEELIHHWARTGSRAHAPKAARYARLAGERALDRLAPHEALERFEHGLALLEHGEVDTAERCDLLIGLGEAQRRLGLPGFRDRLLEASALAERLDDHERITKAVLANTLGPFGAAGPPDEPRVNALVRALEHVPHDWPRRPRIAAILAKERYFGGQPEEGAVLADEALQLARHNNDERELARVLAITTAISDVTPLDRHAALVHELGELAAAADDPELRFRAANARFIYSMHSGAREALDSGVATMRELADAIGQPILVWTTLWAESALLSIRGRLDEAEARTNEASAMAVQHALPHGALIEFGQLMSIRGEQGRLSELAGAVERRIAAAPGLRLLELSRAFIDAETGNLERAAEILAREASNDFEFAYDRTRAFNLARCADIALRVRDRRVGRSLYRHLLPDREQFATTAGVSSRGSIELSLGRLATLLGEIDAADAHLHGAESAHERLGAPLLVARTHVARAEWVLAGGRGRRSASHYLDEALRLARRHGGRAIEREAETVRPSVFRAGEVVA